MIRGGNFEKRCCEYLNNLCGNNTLRFETMGGMDSTVSDIAVIKNGNLEFFIEAKDSNAQSGQFVLIPNDETQTFIFSPRNKSTTNEITDIIIDYMNNDYYEFKNAGTSGREIKLNENLFSTWIIKHYKERNVKYFITSYNSQYVIFPISMFQYYFNISAKYRIKKSGSGSPAKKYINDIEETIRNHYPSCEFILDTNKMFVEIEEPISTTHFQIEKYTYFLSHKSNLLYEIRRLSNTYNMNVIFSIESKRSQKPDDYNSFIDDLYQ